MRDDSSSLVCLRDSASFQTSRSATTATSSMVENEFDFDKVVLGSKVYQSQWRALMKKALKKKGQAQERPLKKSVDKAKPLEDINILLLGPSYDGYSKLFSCRSLFFNTSYSFDERVAAKNRIVEVIYNFLKDTLEIVEPVISPWLRDHAEAVFQQPSTTVHDPEAFPKDLLISLKELWSDQGVRNECMRRIVNGRKPSIS